MKKLTFILTLLTLQSFAQQKLSFDKRFVDCENQWVALMMGKDSSHIFGFVYFDAPAGLSFRKEGNFKFSNGHILKAPSTATSTITIRLQVTNARVALIPTSYYSALKIQQLPDWFDIYRTDSTTAKYFYDRGYLFNAWNDCSKALNYLEKAQKIDKNYRGLTVEMAFSYNCLKQFEKAEKLLSTEVINNPKDAYVNKEYIYTLVRSNKIDLASAQFFKSLTTVPDTQYNVENCFNILGYYYEAKDKTNFKKWYDELGKLTINNKMIRTYADNMKSDLDK